MCIYIYIKILFSLFFPSPFLYSGNTFLSELGIWRHKSFIIIVFDYNLILQVEALAVKLTQKEGELIQEKFEVKKLANYLKQVI